MGLCGISNRFRLLSRRKGQIIHVLLTRPPLKYSSSTPKGFAANISARLACVRRAASVHPEPGSNSHVNWFEICISVEMLCSDYCLRNRFFFRKTTVIQIFIVGYSTAAYSSTCDVTHSINVTSGSLNFFSWYSVFKGQVVEKNYSTFCHPVQALYFSLVQPFLRTTSSERQRLL